MTPRVTYGSATEEIIDLFSAYLVGSSSLPFLVVGNNKLGDAAKNALEKSLTSLGYTAPAYSLILISPDDQAALDAGALRLLVEALDPIRMICADEPSMEALASAYKQDLEPNAINRIMGRNCGVFSNLNDMVQDKTGKHIVWEIFKALK